MACGANECSCWTPHASNEQEQLQPQQYLKLGERGYRAPKHQKWTWWRLVAHEEVRLQVSEMADSWDSWAQQCECCGAAHSIPMQPD